MSADPAGSQEGNVYTAAVDSGGAQKFVPRRGASPAFLLGKQVNLPTTGSLRTNHGMTES
jgi:hypothetical protein